VNVDDGGGVISHNWIHDLAQSGVYGRHWRTDTQEQERRNQEQALIIEYNEIHDVVKDINDGAGIFIRDSNILIRNNLIYNVYAYRYPENTGEYNYTGVPGWGIYLGCETRNSRVENNIVYGVQEGLHVWYGTRNVVIENNIFVDSEIRHVRWETSGGHDLINNRFVRNIIYSTLPYTELYNVQGENTLPAESDYNVIYHAGRGSPIIRSRIESDSGGSWEAWLEHGYEKNSVVADPLFTDPANHDYSLLPGSPALERGFQPIDLSDVGLRGGKD
jgi:parallel beta-helix repeat protein